MDDPGLPRDPLTGALARASLDTLLERGFGRAVQEQKPLALLVIDIDHFKSINDAFGHARGDQVLTEFVKRTAALIRGSDTLLRYGGDEFVVLSTNASKPQATALAQRLLDAIRTTEFPGQPPLRLSLSIGLAASDEVETPQALFDKADARLLEAKRRGRGQVFAKEPSPAEAHPFGEISRLAEREPQLDAVSAFLQALPQSRRGLLEIIGPPASGRSCFLREVARAAQLRGYWVLDLQASPPLATRAFAALLEAGLDEHGERISTRQIPDFIRSLPERLRREQALGLLITVDNVEFLDGHSVAILHNLLAGSDPPVLALVTTAALNRPRLGPGFEAPLYQALTLEPLCLDGLRVWLRHLLQWEPEAPFLDWIFEATGGLPARLQQALAHLHDCGLLEAQGEGWHPVDGYAAFPLADWLVAQAAPRSHNLPPLSFFVGRDHELHLAKQHLAERRLTTLLGPGGIGKSRLALQVAAETLARFSHGAFLAELAPLQVPDHIVPAIADAVGFAFAGGEDLKAQLLNYLRDKHMLLVLDNFEHLLEGASLLTDILEAAPGLTLLVTSRERLNLAHETVLELANLDLPDETNLEAARASSALQLFAQRAAQEQSGGPTEEDLPSVIRICRLVEGMPLGIELAAAWVRMLSPREIADQIQYNVNFLASSRPDIPPRHRSLRAVFDHFWGFLSQAERGVLLRLSLLRGGFRLESAGRVAGASFFFLSALVHKALLRRDPTGRYRMHEVLRQYAEQELFHAREEHRQARDVHCKYFAQFLQDKQPQLKGAGQRRAVREISEEIENIRAAWRWAVGQTRLAELSAALEGLSMFYQVRNWFQEGEEALGQAVECLRACRETSPRVQPFLLAKALAWQGDLLLPLSKHKQAELLLRESLSLFRTLNAPREEAFALNSLGELARLLGEYDRARGHHQEALELYRQAGDSYGEAKSIKLLGIIAGTVGALQEARQLFQESRAIFEKLGNQYEAANTVNNLGIVAGFLGEHKEAKRYYQDTLEVYRAMSDERGVAYALGNMGLAAYDLGEYQEAMDLSVESMAIHKNTGDRTGLAMSSATRGRAALALRRYPIARACLREALQTAKDIGAIPLVLEICPGLAELLAEEGHVERAAQFLVYVANHTASDEGTRNRARKLLEELQVPGQVIATAQQEANTGGFETALEEILAEPLSDNVDPLAFSRLMV